jgi:capsular polysaccharide biosynthesis protein
MEIRDYVGTLRRRIWILILPPILAGAAVLAMAASTPAEYRATATVAAPALIGASDTPYAGPNGPKSFVSDFTAMATSDRIVAKVAAATSVPAARITSGLKVRQVGTSTLMQVTYRSDRRADVQPVAEGIAGEVMKFLPTSQVELAGSLVEQATKAVADVQAELNSFTASSKVFVPDRDYQIKAQQVSDLERQALQAAAEGEAAVAANINAALPAKRAELVALAPKLATYTSLVDKKTRVEQHLAEAQASLEQALAFEKASDPQSVVTINPIKAISRADAAVRKAAVAVGSALFLAIALVVLLEPTGRRPLRFAAHRPVLGRYAPPTVDLSGSGKADGVGGHLEGTPGGGGVVVAAGVPGDGLDAVAAGGRRRPREAPGGGSGAGGAQLDEVALEGAPGAVAVPPQARRLVLDGKAHRGDSTVVGR